MGRRSRRQWWMLRSTVETTDSASAVASIDGGRTPWRSSAVSSTERSPTVRERGSGWLAPSSRNAVSNDEKMAW